jgi:hypothetical protein
MLLNEEIVLPEELPLDAIRSSTRVVLITLDRRVVSEHQTTPDAVRALVGFVSAHPTENAAIYRRRTTHWAKY